MKTKKLFSLILSFAMLIPVLVVPITASAEQDFDYSYYVENNKPGISSSASNINVDSNAVATARKYLRNHETENLLSLPLPVTRFSVTVKTDRYNDSDYCKEYADVLLNKAMEHTGSPIEGDYMLRQMNGYYCTLDSSKKGYVTISYTVSFFTSKAQENEMNTKVSQIIKSLNLNGKTEYQKVKAIYDYLCSNVTYDNLSLDIAMSTQGILHNPVGHSAYGALCKGTSVCQGYATAFYRLALEAGIDSRVIFGTASGGGHAWNIVRIDGKYYLLDSTWDAGNSNYKYFLKCEKEFPDHKPDDEHTTSSWKKTYPIATTSYRIPTYDTIGDVDGDGYITSADSLSVLRISVKLEKAANTKLADVDGSGAVDSSDALEILRYSVGLPVNANIGKKIK